MPWPIPTWRSRGPLGTEWFGLATRFHFTPGDDFAQAVEGMRGKYQWLT